MVSAREVPAHRRSAIAAAWRLPTERVHATAREGALAVELRAGLPPRVLRYRDGLTDGWGPADASPGPPPLGYHPGAR